MTAFRTICLRDGQGLQEALAASRDFVGILADIPFRPSEALRAVASHPSPLVAVEALAFGAAFVCWVLYLLTRNCSHVDRLWSILPPVYVAIFARDDLLAVAAAVRKVLSAGGGASLAQCLLIAAAEALSGASGADPRLLLAVVLSSAWGLRLTYNFWRRGGYSPRYEDYRWTEARTLMSPLLYELFNLVFVSFAQHLLCLLITTPAFVAYLARGRGLLGPTDWAAAAAFVVLLVGEAAADQQQWAFQRRKRELLAANAPRAGDYKRGFCTTGLFRFSRHPSFFCEYGMWWAFYILCAVLPSRCLLGWAAAGAAGLLALFHGGSLWITERISARRYPAYRDYQCTTSAIVPGFPGPRLRDDAD